ncbi:hypothetical protein [Deinococcus aetherius]|uniref:hypothetical protein n=1 Tax=Deinococcus aetherius TaxID=200252 RepID=UPI003872B26C
MWLVLDNLTGHKTPDLVCWLMRQGIMPLYTPVAGSWLNMAESIQRILVRRALTAVTGRVEGRGRVETSRGRRRASRCPEPGVARQERPLRSWRPGYAWRP